MDEYITLKLDNISYHARDNLAVPYNLILRTLVIYRDTVPVFTIRPGAQGIPGNCFHAFSTLLCFHGAAPHQVRIRSRA